MSAPRTNPAGTPGGSLVVSAPADVDPADCILDLVHPAGEAFTGVVPAGAFFAIVDLEGNQAVDTLFYDAHDFTNRYSAALTIQRQGNIFLTTGSELVTVRGDVLARIVADTCGRHDTLGGACSAESNSCRFGHHTRDMHNCRDIFLTGLARHGMTKRDLAPNINFFMNVPVAADGHLDIVDGISHPGAYVTLHAARDTLVVISNCPQLNNPCNGWNPTPVRLMIWTSAAVPAAPGAD